MRPPNREIHVPPFPAKLPWINVASLRIDQQRGRPVLIEFWDFCRVNSLRTLPYLKAWHERYESLGLRVIGVHAAGFECSAHPDAVRDAVDRLGIEYPVVVDVEHEVWSLYGNLGWPARYLFDQEGRLFDFHYGEGGYDETERAIQELLGLDAGDVAAPALVSPVHPEDAPDAELAIQSDDITGPYSGPYEAGGVWAVLDGRGTVTANGRLIAVDHPGCYELIAHDRHTAGELSLSLSEGVRCHAVCFTPGLTR
jgi:thiol-disulfide isomerase/thioredoxin